MPHLQSITITPQPIDRFAPLVGSEAIREAHTAAEAVRRRLNGRVIWNVSSTAVGGGVAEMVQPLLRYTRGVGIDTRWVVIRGTPEFFRVTKRLHHALHGSIGDGSSLDGAARALYEDTLADNTDELVDGVRPGDVVILHDPQTAGLAPSLLDAGARIIWRCHVGHDEVSDEMERAWAFLASYLADASAYVFSRRAFLPSALDRERCHVIPPSIDPFSAKNQELDARTVHTALVLTGLVEGPLPAPARLRYQRADGSPGRIEHRADLIRMGRPPTWETPVVVQVSRWDPLKDPIGVMHGFAAAVDGRESPAAELIIAGPNVSAVSDDPEGAATLDATIRAWRELPHSVRDRIHLACLPMLDVEENATIVNALQRHACVVVQKSLREGFGLTVAEAMWKARPVLASAVGGIQDQIEDARSGVLLKDPGDTDAFAARLGELLQNPDLRESLGQAAHERVREHFLGLRHLLSYARLMEQVAGEA